MGVVDLNAAAGGQRLAECLGHYHERRVLDARSTSKKLELCDPQLWKKHSEKMIRIEHEYQDLLDAIHLLQIPTRLPCVRTDACASIFFSGPPITGPTHVDRMPPTCLVLDAIVNADMRYVLVLLCEVGLYSSWLKGIVLDSYCTFSTEQRRERESWVCYESPYPLFLYNRDVCVSSQVFDCLSAEPPYILFVIEDASPASVPANCKQETTRARVHKSVVRVALCPNGAVRVTAYAALDLKTKYCPSTMSTHIVASMASDMVQLLSDRANEIALAHKKQIGCASRVSTDPHVRAIEDREDFYGKMFERLQKCCRG